MTQQIPTEEELMALADAALSPSETERILRLVKSDPALQRRIEIYAQTRDAIREARGPIEGEPVPDALRQSIEQMISESEQESEHGGKVTAFRSRPKAAPSRPSWVMPIAASVIAVIGGIAGYVAGQSGGNSTMQTLASVGEIIPSELGSVLSSQASGSEAAVAGGKLRLIATLRSKSGSLCREFELDRADGQSIVGVSCHEADGWRVDIAVAAPQSQEGFAPASSLNAIDSYLGMIEASEPLGGDEEATALSTVN